MTMISLSEDKTVYAVWEDHVGSGKEYTVTDSANEFSEVSGLTTPELVEE